MAEHYIPSNPFYSATVLHSATEQYRPGSRNADVYGMARTNAFDAGIKEEISRRESLGMALLESLRRGCMVLFFSSDS